MATRRDTPSRDAIVRKCEKLAFDAERAGDKVLAEHYFQMAENYRRSKEHEQ